ncbi:MAG: dihydrodipicolinate synthase family protein, partial [Alphaproteobacteria bacterium]
AQQHKIKNPMTNQSACHGLWVPALTPFTADLEVDVARFIAHCHWLLANGANGLAAFGTTSEANSLSGGERMALLDQLVEAGIAPSALMPGTGCCALPDTVALTRHAVDHGCAGVLLLPPFYYKGIGDDGIYAGIARLIERIADDRLKIYLYHIPPMAGVGFSLDLIGRLLKDFPDKIAGLKDSSGDWSNTAAILKNYPSLAVFPGSEIFLLDGLRAGSAGCISASANVNTAAISALYEHYRNNGQDLDASQERLTLLRRTFETQPMVPGLKAIIAHARSDPAWRTARPPLVPLNEASAATLFEKLNQLDFAWPI